MLERRTDKVTIDVTMIAEEKVLIRLLLKCVSKPKAPCLAKSFDYTFKYNKNVELAWNF